MVQLRLIGKKALVTGAGTGLGRAIALELAKQGTDLALQYNTSASSVEKVLDECRALGRDAAVFQVDLRDPEAAIMLPNLVAERLGRIDILVNNAGLTTTCGFHDMSINDYNDMFDLNIRGMFFCTQSSVKHMKAAGGTVINISSVHGMQSLPGFSAYAATKGAIIAFSKQLAIEVAKNNIRVNCIAPGCIIVDKDFERHPDLDINLLGASIPMGITGIPSDVAQMTVFLASEDARYITGAVIPIDGGLLAKLAFITPSSTEM